MKKMLIISSLLLCLMAVGCAKKEDPDNQTSPESVNQTQSEATHNSPSNQNFLQTSGVTFDQVLELWQDGQQTKAAELFLGIDWESSNIFDSESIFLISEADFLKLSSGQQIQIKQKAMDLSNRIKELAKYLVELEKQQGDSEGKYRDSLLACAQKLSSDDQLEAVQMVGVAVVKYIDTQLSQ